MPALNGLSYFWRDKRGTASIEYAILSSLISVTLVASVASAIPPIRTAFVTVANALVGRHEEVPSGPNTSTASNSQTDTNSSSIQSGSDSSCSVAHENCGVGKNSQGLNTAQGNGSQGLKTAQGNARKKS